MGTKPLHIETARHRRTPDQGTKHAFQGLADRCVKRVLEARAAGKAG